MKNFSTKRIVRAAIIAAVYLSMTLAFMPISYGPVQFRISEALTILPMFCPEAVVGLAVGCLIANIFSPGAVMLDLIFGTLATLVAAILTYFIGKLIKKDWRICIGVIPPIIINAIVVPFTFLALSQLKEFYLFNVLTVAAGQAAVIIGLGIPLYFLLNKVKDKIFI